MTDRHDSPPSTSDAGAGLPAQDRPLRRKYARPELTCFGRVEDLTRAGGTTGKEFGSKKRQ